jgi:hypothetical protein
VSGLLWNCGNVQEQQIGSLFKVKAIEAAKLRLKVA